MESESELLLSKIDKKIEKLYFSVFCFMQANPRFPKEKSPDISPFQLNRTQSKISLNRSSSDLNAEFVVQDSKENSIQGSYSKSLNNRNLGLNFMISNDFRKAVIDKLNSFKVTFQICSLTKANLFEILTKVQKIKMF